MHKIKKQAIYKNLGLFLDFVKNRALACGVDKRTMPDIILAVEELLVNIISYAFPDKENGYILLECEKDNSNRMVITITDHGIPFDAVAAQDPDVSTPIAERGIGGMGIFLAKNVVDELTYKRKGNSNILTIKKSIKVG